jgi:hypothetical protein
MRVIACVEGDLGHGLLAQLQLRRRAFKAESSDVAVHRLAKHAGEHAVKVKRRKASQACEIIKIQRLIQLLLDMNKNPEDPLFVILERNCLARFVHWIRLHQNVGTERLMLFAKNVGGRFSRLLQRPVPRDE